jgi:RNA polymerase sigma-70 factor (ECF subfamily)
MERQWRVVEAFVKASREGDFEGLLRVLHPDVVVRTDGHIAGPRETRGAADVARTASSFRRYASSGRPVIVDGLPAAIVVPAGRPFALLKFTIEDDRIRAIDVVGDPERLAEVAAGTPER